MPKVIFPVEGAFITSAALESALIPILPLFETLAFELILIFPSLVILLAILTYIPTEFSTLSLILIIPSEVFFTLFEAKFTPLFTKPSSINAIPVELLAESLPFFCKLIVPEFSYFAFAPVLPANFIPWLSFPDKLIVPLFSNVPLKTVSVLAWILGKNTYIPIEFPPLKSIIPLLINNVLSKLIFSGTTAIPIL